MHFYSTDNNQHQHRLFHCIIDKSTDYKWINIDDTAFNYSNDVSSANPNLSFTLFSFYRVVWRIFHNFSIFNFDFYSILSAFLFPQRILMEKVVLFQFHPTGGICLSVALPFRFHSGETFLPSLCIRCSCYKQMAALQEIFNRNGKTSEKKRNIFKIWKMDEAKPISWEEQKIINNDAFF